MENLIKQTRRKFSGAPQDNKDEGSTSRDRKIAPQKTQSFREKRRSQSWIRRQFSRQLSWDNDFSGADYPTAVAAAAYAIQSLEESKAEDQKATTSGPDKSLSKKKSKIDYTEVPLEPRKSALKSSDTFKDSDTTIKASTSKKMPEKVLSSKKIAFADTEETSRNKTGKSLEKAPSSMRRPSIIAAKQLNIGDDKKPETSLPKPDRPLERRPTTQSVETRKQSAATKPGPGDSQADAWEKEEMASIKERYEKLRETIDNWETKKKKKAKRKIEKIEAEMDKRRVKAMQRYHGEMSRVGGIAGGARAQAEENRKNEELKVKEKANRIRSTGKLPPTCLCF